MGLTYDSIMTGKHDENMNATEKKNIIKSLGLTKLGTGIKGEGKQMSAADVRKAEGRKAGTRSTGSYAKRKAERVGRRSDPHRRRGK
jgi:hypothetical protein